MILISIFQNDNVISVLISYQIIVKGSTLMIKYFPIVGSFYKKHIPLKRMKLNRKTKLRVISHTIIQILTVYHCLSW